MNLDREQLRDQLPGLDPERVMVAAERRVGPNGEVLYVDPVSLAALEAVREAVGMSGRPLMPVGASLPDIEDLPLEFAVLQTRFEMLEARVTRLEARARLADAREDRPL